MLNINELYLGGCVLVWFMIVLASTTTRCSSGMMMNHVTHGFSTESTTMRPTTTSSTITTSTSREIQQEYHYRANYTADFQLKMMDSYCSAEAPIIEISCWGTSMSIVHTSHDSIICIEANISRIIDGTTFECHNTCQTSDECATSTYLHNQMGTALDGPFASIEFMCQGDTYEQVNAAMIYIDGNNGNCSDSMDSSLGIVHVGRLGVSCPSGTSSAYIYEDSYFECNSNSSFSLNLGENIYGCSNGNFCNGAACDIQFSNFTISTDLSSFLYTCVEFDLTAITDIPIFSSTFEASWWIYQDTVEISANCTSSNQTISITCDNGSSITFISSPDHLLQCKHNGVNEIACTGDPTILFNSATYECLGPQLPSSHITYPESIVAACESNTETYDSENKTYTTQHLLTMGVYCDLPEGSLFVHSDVYFECTETGNVFYAVSVGADDIRHACSESVTFTAGSQPTDTRTIPKVVIGTDNSWLNEPKVGCYSMTNVVEMPVSMPTSPPKIPAIPSPPTNNSTLSLTSSSDDSSSALTIGAAVGGAIGLMLLLYVLGIYFFRNIGVSKSSIGRPEVPKNDIALKPVLDTTPKVISHQSVEYKDQARSCDPTHRIYEVRHVPTPLMPSTTGEIVAENIIPMVTAIALNNTKTASIQPKKMHLEPPGHHMGEPSHSRNENNAFLNV